MNNFFKTFFAALLALVVFSLIAFFIFLGIVAAASSSDKPTVSPNSVLVLDLSKEYHDFEQPALKINLNLKKLSTSQPNLYAVIQMIRYARNDANIKGIYIKADNNANGLAASEELRHAILDFKRSGKFVVAYGATITQNAYFVASAANKVYTHPQGGVEWKGMVAQLMFFKNLLDKLEIEPEIFFAGKFKSATEPFRVTKMTEPNRLQTSVWLNDIYGNYLKEISQSRNIDTSELHHLADSALIQTAHDALKYHLVDDLAYSDEVESVIKTFTSLGTQNNDKINFVSLDTYAQATDYKAFTGNDNIAVVYAQGDIVDGKNDDAISSGEFVPLLRKLRKDDNVKAIVVRVNSPGGSALASDMIWREITLAKKVKPVIISMGNYAASGGYYMSCNGTYIFAEPNTITGSIGVFSMMGNAQNFFNNKLGITFDEVKTSPYADLGTISRPMTQPEKNLMQASVDSVYKTFTERVAQGRNKSVAFVDSIAQGRVWTGERAIKIGLVDSLGSLADAIHYAAKLVHSNSVYISEYPERKNIFDQLFNSDDNDADDAKAKILSQQFGKEISDSWKNIMSVKAMMNTPQTRLPFEFEVK
ncbi:signal peptide peptidase SppA [Arachidicoccus ginsenosidimutans]|uniref:signal peptide peptidase SppA n=1 Tax=Arachidicoccus sp. BS20 TaxID=1850526 RepID=UPI0007F185B0|nr:signal peptide peptidase SppA [Arachidicoccus sp. BS20]ANI90500.1 signal peptide peptidase SppA [Arachidicoccus sp. BS20]